jgi:maleylacetate reductase
MQSGTYSYPGTKRVVYGTPMEEALAQELALDDAGRVFVLASATLARETDLVQRLRAVLGDRCAGIFTGIGAHTPRSSVVAAANQARAAQADLLLGLGGGSITDAVKMVALCLANDVSEPAALDRLRNVTRPDGSTVRPPVNAPAIASVIIPTTLSAGEF